jgi:hypothetical protein
MPRRRVQAGVRRDALRILKGADAGLKDMQVRVYAPIGSESALQAEPGPRRTTSGRAKGSER